MLAVHWGLRGGCWQEHLCGLCIWSSCFLIAISEDQVEVATLFMTYLGIHVRSLSSQSHQDSRGGKIDPISLWRGIYFTLKNEQVEWEICCDYFWKV